MCNTFSGCLKLVLSSTLLCWGVAHVQCYWSCLTWTVAWSWWKDNVTSTFLTYCNVSSPSLSITGRTNSHKLTQVTLFTARQLYQWSPPRRTSAGVTDGLPTPRLCPRDFKPLHPHTSVPLKLNMHTIMYLLLVFLCSTWWHVPFFCFFCKFGCQRHTKKIKITKKKLKKHISKPLRVRFWGEHNLNQGCWVRITARGPSRPLTSS